MTTIDNGGKAFSVVPNHGDNPKMATIFKHCDYVEYEELFDGNPKGDYRNENSACLLHLGDLRYLFIGTEMYSFTTTEPILEFNAPIGNSGVSYPVAVSKKSMFFMLDKICVPVGLIPSNIPAIEQHQAYYVLEKRDKNNVLFDEFLDVRVHEGRVLDSVSA